MKSFRSLKWLDYFAGTLISVCIALTVFPFSAAAFDERQLISDLYRFDRSKIQKATNEELLSYRDELSTWVKNIVEEPSLSKDDKLHWLGRIQEKLKLVADISSEKVAYYDAELHHLELERERQRMKTDAMLREIQRRGQGQ